MSPLEHNIVESIRRGRNTFSRLSLLVPAGEARLVDKALKRLKGQGVVEWDRKERVWKVRDS